MRHQIDVGDLAAWPRAGGGQFYVGRAHVPALVADPRAAPREDIRRDHANPRPRVQQLAAAIEGIHVAGRFR